MRSKFRNIQTILFSTYSLIIVVVFAVLVALFYWWSSDLLRQNAVESLAGMGQSMQEHYDSEIQKMNDVSLNVMYSNLVKNRFKQYIAGENGSPGSEPPTNSVENAKELAEILTAAIGPSRPVEQLYLYDFKNKVYGNGFDNGERTYDPKSKTWYHQVVNNDQGKFLNMPVPDAEMTKFISSPETQYSISLFRLFYDSYNDPMGIIEVKQYYNKIFKSVLEFSEQNPYDAKVLVYNGNGQIVYPLGPDARQYSEYLNLPASAANETYTPFVNPVTKEKELLSVHHSDFTGWNTVIIVSEKRLLSPLSAFAKQTVLVAFAIMLFAILLSYAAAKKITYPILKIHRSIRNMRLEDLGTGRVAARELNSGLSELDELHQSFQQMSGRLRQSMDELLLSQSQELQAKLVALQSQMNPHFLYNTLATIHAMAEENMNGQIIAMTENMSDFLRYFSSDESLVDLREEALHTEKYLEINRIRYGRKLQYEFDIDESMLDQQIPKLIIQPLVENALKFCTRGEPPWRIRISGKAEDGQWRIEVADNGPGFSAESLAHLQGRIREVDETNIIPVLKLDGMGLLNIYIRLKLTYGEKAEFRIDSRPGEGATIRMGGMLAEMPSDLAGG